MLKVLYYDRESIIKTLAESIVIGGLPKNETKIESNSILEEINEVKRYLTYLDEYKDLLIEKIDSNGHKYIDVNLEHFNHTYLINMGKYYRRAKALGQVPAGSGHNCMYKGVSFNMIIEFPLYWLKEYQRYHFTDIISSQSTMHKMTEFDLNLMYNSEVDPRVVEIMKELIQEYKQETDKDKKKELWRKIINTNPDGFTMAMGITMNYLQALSIVQQREHHKLIEWREDFVPFLKDLPCFSLFLLGDNEYGKKENN